MFMAISTLTHTHTLTAPFDTFGINVCLCEQVCLDVWESSGKKSKVDSVAFECYVSHITNRIE